MSTRAIAPIVGANYQTVQKDIREAPGRDSTTSPEPRQITGRDGKTYTRPAPEPVTVDHETGVDGGVRVWVSRNVTPMCYSNGYDDFGPRVRAV